MKNLICSAVLAIGLILPLTGLGSPAILSEQLYDGKNWILVESTDEGISIAEKEIDGIAVKAVMVSQTIEIDPETLAQVIEDIANYGRFLSSAPGMEATLLCKSSK